MIINVGPSGQTGVTLEIEFSETLRVGVDQGEEEHRETMLLGTHYSLQALILVLPLDRMFVADGRALYMLPEETSKLESLEWGEGEHRLVLKKLHLGEGV